MYAKLRSSGWAAALICCPVLVWADEPKADEAPKTEAATPAAEAPADDVAKLIKDLDANRFSQRQAATEKLTEVGKAAIPALTEAAGQESREASTRAVDILKRHLQGADAELKTAAKEALEKIAKGGNDAAARRAQEALKPPAETQNQPAIGGIQLVPGGGNIQIGGGQIQIQVQGGIGGPGGFNAKRISVKNVNGVKEIEAVEGDRTVKINEDANGGIKVEVTKKKDGKDTTEKYEAKNLEELKKNHPEGAKLYEEYAQGKGAIKINAIQVGGPGGAIPMPALPNIQIAQGQLVPAFGAAGGGKEQAEKLKQLGKRLDDLKEQVKKLGEGKSEDLKKALDEIDAAQKEIGELQKQAEAGAPAFEGVEKAAQEALKKIQDEVQKNVDEAKKAAEGAAEGNQ